MQPKLRGLAALLGSAGALAVPQAAQAAKPRVSCVNNTDGTFTVTVTNGVKTASYTLAGSCPTV